MCVHSLPFVENHFDFDTHFGLTDGQKVWKLKIYYQSFICVMCCAVSSMHLSFVYGSNQINKWMWYACATYKTHSTDEPLFDTPVCLLMIIIFPCAHSTHLSSSLFVRLSQINIILNFIKVDAIFFTTFAQNTLNKTPTADVLFVLWGRKFPIKNPSQILQRERKNV